MARIVPTLIAAAATHASFAAGAFVVESPDVNSGRP